jgi:hypothetical protein
MGMGGRYRCVHRDQSGYPGGRLRAWRSARGVQRRCQQAPVRLGKVLEMNRVQCGFPQGRGSAGHSVALEEHDGVIAQRARQSGALRADRVMRLADRSR